MNKRYLYHYRRDNGLCVNCGEPAAEGKTRCVACAQFECAKAKCRYASLTPQEKHMRYLREMRWRERNPEKVAVYKSRQVQYNKKYREGFKNDCKW